MWGPASSSSRVLVVDDNVDTALSLLCLLQLYGHEVHVAHSGRAALEAAHELLPDAIILDIGLPDLDGFEVARRLRAGPELASCLLIAATSFSRDRDRLQASEAGFDHYLVKPFDLAWVDRLLTARRPAAVGV